MADSSIRIAYKIVDRSSGAQAIRVWEPWVSGGKDSNYASYHSTGQLVLTSTQNDIWFEAVRPVVPESTHADALMDVRVDAREIHLNPKEMDLKNRRGPGVQRGSGSYTIPHGGVSLLGEPVKFRKILVDLVKAKIVGLDYTIQHAPEWRGKTVGDVLGIAPKDMHDPIQEITRGNMGKIFLYHGTSAKRWEFIKTQGLRPGKTPVSYQDLIQGYSDHNVYLTTSVGEAENFATRAAVDDQAKAVVLKVEVNDFSKLVIDEDTAGWITYKGKEWHFKHEEWRKSPDAAAIMALYQAKLLYGLRVFNVVAYRGKIPSDKIKVLLTYKPRSMKKEPDDAQFEAAMNKTRETIKWDPAKVASRYMAAVQTAPMVRETWPDGRWKPLPGDVVFQQVPGLYGAAIVKGSAVKYGDRVKIKCQGKWHPATDRWSVENDPEVLRRINKREMDKIEGESNKQRIMAEAAVAIEATARRKGLKRIQSIQDVAVGSLVYSIASQGSYGDGDPRKIQVREMTVVFVDSSEFEYEDDLGSTRMSGDITRWWVPD